MCVFGGGGGDGDGDSGTLSPHRSCFCHVRPAPRRPPWPGLQGRGHQSWRPVPGQAALRASAKRAGTAIHRTPLPGEGAEHNYNPTSRHRNETRGKGQRKGSVEAAANWSRALAADGGIPAQPGGSVRFALGEINANAAGNGFLPGWVSPMAAAERSAPSPGPTSAVLGAGFLSLFPFGAGCPEVPSLLLLREQPFPPDVPSKGDVRSSREQGPPALGGGGDLRMFSFLCSPSGVGTDGAEPLSGGAGPRLGGAPRALGDPGGPSGTGLAAFTWGPRSRRLSAARPDRSVPRPVLMNSVFAPN